jgi:hypothetical protein
VTRQAGDDHALLARVKNRPDAAAMVEAVAVEDLDEFLAFLDRHQTDVALRKLHYLRLIMGMIGAGAVIIFNVLRITPPGAEEVVTQVATVVCTAYVLACLTTLVLMRRRFVADLRRQAASLRERVWQVANFIHRQGNILLLLAATGQAVVLLGTEFRLRLFGADGAVLSICLVPSLLLLVHGLGDIPTRHRLQRLYAINVATLRDL